MAPSFDIGNPQRSLVRIPGSGQDKNLKPICLDVAQISNFSRHLSEITNFNFSPPNDEPVGGTISIVSPSTTNSNANNPPIRDQSAAAGPNNNGNRGSQKRGSSEKIEPSPKRAANEKDKVSPNESLTPQERIKKYKTLESEKEKLEKENEELSKKVDMFKDIIRSRSKLKEFQAALHEIDAKG